MSIPLDKAEIIALFVECTLYGVFCVLFVACIWILVYKRLTDRVNYPMVATAVAMWALATAHVSIDLRRMLEAFYTHRDDPGGPVGFFSDVRHITHVLKSAIYITHTCVSDCLVVYRTHMVVRQRSVTTFLILMVIGTAVSGYGSIYVLVHMSALTGSIFATGLAPWITAFNVITAATNIIATALIAGRIWYVNRRIGSLIHRGSRTLHSVVIMIVESGAIYAASLILLTSFYTTDSNAQFIVLDAVTPLIGIVFTVIIIRVGLKVRGCETDISSIRRVDIPTTKRSTSGYPLSPMSVNVSTVVEYDLNNKAMGITDHGTPNASHKDFNIHSGKPGSELDEA